MSKNWKRGLALLMAAMMLAPSSNLTAWQTALGTAMIAEAAVGATHNIIYHDTASDTSAPYSGEDPTTTQFVEGTTPTITMPTKPGYSAKLYTAADTTDPATKEILADGTNFPKDTQTEVDVYVKWTLETYNITYELNGGTRTSTVNTYDVENPATLDVPTKSGFTFAGYYTSSDFNPDTLIAGTSDPKTNPTLNIGASSVAPGTFAGDVTLYAKWDEDTYTISYLAYDNYTSVNDIKLKSNDSVDKTVAEDDNLLDWKGILADDVMTEYNNVDNKVAIPLPTSVTLPGYKFLGWQTANKTTGGASTVTSINANTNDNITVYAKFDDTTTTTFDYNGQTVSTNSSDTFGVTSSTVGGDSYVTVPDAPITLDDHDYILFGWNTKADGTGALVTTKTKTSELTGNTVYAINKKLPVPVFKQADGSAVSSGAVVATSTGHVTINTNEFSSPVYTDADGNYVGKFKIDYLPTAPADPYAGTPKAGLYRFAGWYSSANFEEQFKVEVGDFVESDTPTYYAKWVGKNVEETTQFSIVPDASTNAKDYAVKVVYVNGTIGAANGEPCNGDGQTEDEWQAASDAGVPGTEGAWNPTGYTPDRASDGSYIVAKNADVTVTVSTVGAAVSETIVDTVKGLSTVDSAAVGGTWTGTFTASKLANSTLTVATKPNLQSTVTASVTKGAGSNGAKVIIDDAVDQEGKALKNKDIVDGAQTAYLSMKKDNTITFKVVPEKGSYVTSVTYTVAGTTYTKDALGNTLAGATGEYLKYASESDTQVYTIELPMDVNDYTDPDDPEKWVYASRAVTIDVTTEDDTATTEIKVVDDGKTNFKVVEYFNTADDTTDPLTLLNNYEREIEPKFGRYYVHTQAITGGNALSVGNEVKVVGTAKTTGDTVKIFKAADADDYKNYVDQKAHTVSPVGESYNTYAAVIDSAKPYMVATSKETTYTVAVQDMDGGSTIVNQQPGGASSYAGIAISSEEIRGTGSFDASAITLDDAAYGKDYVFYAYPVEKVDSTDVTKEDTDAILAIKASVDGAFVPVTKLANNKYKIAGSDIKGFGQSDSVGTPVSILIRASREAEDENTLAATAKVFDHEFNYVTGVTDKIEYNSIEAVSNQVKTYHVEITPSGLDKHINANLLETKVIKDSAISTFAATLTPSNTWTSDYVATADLDIDATTVLSGNEVIEIYYNNELIKSIPVTVIPGMGDGITAKATYVSDTKATLELTANAAKVFQAKYDKYGAVADYGIVDITAAAQEQLYYVVTYKSVKDILIETDNYCDEYTYVVPFTGNKQVVDIDFTNGEIPEGAGLGNAFKVDVALVRDAEGLDASSFATAGASSLAGVPLKDTLTAAAIAAAKDAGTLLQTSLNVETVVPIYETDLTFTKGQTTIVADVAYDTTNLNRERDDDVSILTANYTSKTSYKSIEVTEVKAKKVNNKGIYAGADYFSLADYITAKNPLGISGRNISTVFATSADGKELIVKNTVGVKPGTYELTVEAYAPANYKVVNPATTKVVVTIVPNDETLTEYPAIIRPDYTKKNMSVQPLKVAGKNAVKSVTYSLKDGVVYSKYIGANDPANVAVNPAQLGITYNSNGIMSILRNEPSLDGIKFIAVANVTYKDGATFKYELPVTIEKEAAHKLTNIVLVKTADLGALTIDKFIDTEIDIDELNSGAYSIIGVEIDEDDKVTQIGNEALVTIAKGYAIDATYPLGNPIVLAANDNVVTPFATKPGTFTVKAQMMDFSKVTKTLSIKVTPSKNKVGAEIYDYDNCDNVQAGALISTMENDCELSQPITVEVGAVDATPALDSTKYSSTSVAIKGGKVVWSAKGNLGNAIYTILPTAAKTTVTVKNLVDKTDVKTYTITNKEYVDLKAISFKPDRKVNGSVDSDTTQVVKVVLSGNATQLAATDYVELSADSLEIEVDRAQAVYMQNKTAANLLAFQRAVARYETACDIISTAEYHNPTGYNGDNNSSHFQVMSSAVGGKIQFFVELDLTNAPSGLTGANYEGFAAGTYGLDVTCLDTELNVAPYNTLLKSAKMSKLNIQVVNVKPSVTPVKTLAITDVVGEKADIQWQAKNNSIIDVVGISYYKDPVTGKRNYFDSYFDVDPEGRVTVLKTGATGNDLKGIVNYYVCDQNGRQVDGVLRTFELTMIPTAPTKSVDELTRDGIREAVSRAAIEKAYKAGTTIDDNLLDLLVKEELEARGYKTSVSWTVKHPSSINATVTVTSVTDTAPTASNIGNLVATIDVKVATKFFTEAEAKAYNTAHGLVGTAAVYPGDPVRGWTGAVGAITYEDDFIHIDLDEDYGKKEPCKTIGQAIAAIEALGAPGQNSYSIFTGVESIDKAMFLEMAQKQAGEGWKVTIDEDTWKGNYHAMTAAADGSASCKFIVTKTDDKRRQLKTGTVTINLNAFIKLSQAKAMVDNALSTGTYPVGITVDKIVAKLQKMLDAENANAFKVYSDNTLVVTESTPTKVGSVKGYVSIVRIDNVVDETNVALNQKSASINKPLVKVTNSADSALEIALAALNDDSFKLTNDQTNAQLKSAVQTWAQNAINDTLGAGTYVVKVRDFTVTSGTVSCTVNICPANTDIATRGASGTFTKATVEP